MPQHWEATLRGAKKLKLVNIFGNQYQLTPIGEAVKMLLPNNISTWSQTHLRTNRQMSLAQYNPQAAALLRILLVDEPVVRLVIKGLREHPNQSVNCTELAAICDQIEHNRALIFFFNPKLIEDITDERGRIVWNKIKGENYRSTTYYTYKRLLQHAGILKWGKLGEPRPKDYKPIEDIWELA